MNVRIQENIALSSPQCLFSIENLDAKAHANFYWAELISKPTNHVPALFFAAKHRTTEQFNVDQ
jgi:hypothetical protein